MVRNRLYKNSVTYQRYLNGLNSRLEWIKNLKKKYEETGVISWIILREITELKQFLKFHRLKLNEDWYEQLWNGRYKILWVIGIPTRMNRGEGWEVHGMGKSVWRKRRTTIQK